jgi:hypothetical protein
MRIAAEAPYFDKITFGLTVRAAPEWAMGCQLNFSLDVGIA